MLALFRNRKNMLLISIALAFFLASQTWAQTGPRKPNLHVLSIGVNNPQYLEPKHWLKAAANDAQAEVRFWTAQQGQLYNVVRARAPLTNARATCAAILTSLDRLSENVQPGDTAVITLSGHGGCAGPRQEWAFCAYDDPLSAGSLQSRLEALTKKGVRVLLIVDTCQSGGIGIHGDNIIVLAACADDEDALDGKNEQDNGVYTKALLEGLSGAADANKDGTITLAELNAYAALRVEQLNRRQCPTCGCPARVRSSLPLAKITPPAPGSANQSSAPTDSIHSQN